MGPLAHLFNLFMYGAIIFVVLAVVFMAIYFRWKALGQERGI